MLMAIVAFLADSLTRCRCTTDRSSHQTTRKIRNCQSGHSRAPAFLPGHCGAHKNTTHPEREAATAVTRAPRVRRLDLASEVQALYVEAQAAALSLELARSRVEIAETLANEVQRRVDEARDPLFAGTRARTQLAEARVDLGLAEHAFEAALARLALLTGGDPRSIGVVTSGFLEAEEIAITTADLTPVDLAVFQGCGGGDTTAAAAATTASP